ncbi:hypothetical protein BSK49_16470 [Paenibacillus odorifer]|jgi:hypothetical protein|uniref:Phage protein n=1 Tax=Paenibacillus odorifer TaxID=189426 RepID=A0ABX3GF80_9BACL|nr:hypothetical protein [Paenibacillus odorifer]OMD12183.1 hypothetical protein BSO21_28360 [Paenibacillus odorifer]OMD88239.1 hypothetical protein BSK49_16470 [Paenibacillus odorifer]
MTQVKDKTVIEFDGNAYIREEFSEGSARCFLITDYCTDPAASLEVQTKAIEVDAQGYLYNLATVVNGYEAADIWEDDEIISMLKAAPRERVEAAYITLSSLK